MLCSNRINETMLRRRLLTFSLFCLSDHSAHAVLLKRDQAIHSEQFDNSIQVSQIKSSDQLSGEIGRSVDRIESASVLSVIDSVWIGFLPL